MLKCDSKNEESPNGAKPAAAHIYTSRCIVRCLSLAGRSGSCPSDTKCGWYPLTVRCWRGWRMTHWRTSKKLGPNVNKPQSMKSN